jgi:ANTAR domain-containing protein/GAF domain-containing protein
MTATHDDQLVLALRRAASGLVRQNIRDMEVVLTQIVASAAETVPGAAGGGITRTERGTLQACHATDDAIRDLDRLQLELDQGPCLVAADDPVPCGVVVAHDLTGRADTERWPRFAPAAVRAGYHSVLSAQLASTGRGRLAALNLYAHEPGVFTDQARTVAGLFATQASLLLLGADQAAYLQRAVDSRDVIGQAKGILMERFRVDAGQAFEMLIASSQQTNLKLVDVAQWLTEPDEHLAPSSTPAPLRAV